MCLLIGTVFQVSDVVRGPLVMIVVLKFKNLYDRLFNCYKTRGGSTMIFKDLGHMYK